MAKNSEKTMQRNCVKTEKKESVKSQRLLALGAKVGRTDERKKKEGGGVVVSQLEKDWITAVRKVSANTNSPWLHASV